MGTVSDLPPHLLEAELHLTFPTLPLTISDQIQAKSPEFGGADEAPNDLFHGPSISWQLQHLSSSQKRATKIAQASVSF